MLASSLGPPKRNLYPLQTELFGKVLQDCVYLNSWRLVAAAMAPAATKWGRNCGEERPALDHEGQNWWWRWWCCSTCGRWWWLVSWWCGQTQQEGQGTDGQILHNWMASSEKTRSLRIGGWRPSSTVSVWVKDVWTVLLVHFSSHSDTKNVSTVCRTVLRYCLKFSPRSFCWRFHKLTWR